MANDDQKDVSKEYYNVPPAQIAIEPAMSTGTTGSSSVTSEEPARARPPRVCDDGDDAPSKMPSYCNLPRDATGEPPMLPRRQPNMRRSPVTRRSHPPPPPPPAAASSYLPNGASAASTAAGSRCAGRTCSTSSSSKPVTSYQSYRRRVPISRSRTATLVGGSAVVSRRPSAAAASSSSCRCGGAKAASSSSNTLGSFRSGDGELKSRGQDDKSMASQFKVEE